MVTVFIMREAGTFRLLKWPGMTNDFIAKKMIVAAFLYFFSGTQIDFIVLPKEKFFLAALMKQKHETLITQQKLTYQRRKCKTIR